MASDAPGIRVSDRVHERLRAQILEDRLAPGDALPSERTLAEELGVNRHAVREALKRLEQAGLVQITQGGATRVLDWRDSAGLEVLLDLAVGAGPPPRELVRAVLEMRVSVGVDAARLCAARAGARERARIGELAEQVAEGIGTNPAEALGDFVGLWESIVDGSGNVAYRLALNSLTRALGAYPETAAAALPTDPPGTRELGKAIAGGDPEAAAGAAGRLLQRDVDALG
jgi:GntR family transcriptional repressor for pyruvate dehydrogenase complex